MLLNSLGDLWSTTGISVEHQYYNRNPIVKEFGINITEEAECCKCKLKTLHDIFEMSFNLTIPNSESEVEYSLEELLFREIKREQRCSNENSNSIHMVKNNIAVSPPTLMVQLSRYSFESGEGLKKKNVIHLAESIVLPSAW